jgi:hypothetical protein
MADRVFLRLSEKYALGADELQWILYRANGRDHVADPPLELKYWRAISFVSSAKAILHRCMREAGCVPVCRAASELAGYPGTFDAWKAAGAAVTTPHGPHLCPACEEELAA